MIFVDHHLDGNGRLSNADDLPLVGNDPHQTSLGNRHRDQIDHHDPLDRFDHPGPPDRFDHHDLPDHIDLGDSLVPRIALLVHPAVPFCPLSILPLATDTREPKRYPWT